MVRGALVAGTHHWHHLLTHTAGLQKYRADLASMEYAVRNQPLPAPPSINTTPPAAAPELEDADIPPPFRRYVGRYKNHNPEDSAVRVFVRHGQLRAAHSRDDNGAPLVRLGPALFKPATPDFNPERYRFDTIIEGHALRLIFSGMPMYRADDFAPGARD
jgi:hypothetical protein